MRFQGKTIIVTGGAQGIGRACVQGFVAEGGAVVIADLAVEAGEELARGICAQGGRAKFVRTDVGDARRIVGDTGHIVPPRNVDALAQAIAALAGEPENERMMRRQRARARIEAEYPLARAAEAYAQLYRSLL